jgi:predicted ATP-binding protein involved in virulence
MRIDEIAITNFRNIEDETCFRFNPNFTVIIGINGKGKSTILHALRIAAGSYLLGIPEAPKRHIWENEIRRKDFGTHIALQTPTIIRAKGEVNEQLLESWQRKIPEGKIKTTSSNEDVGDIRNIAKSKYNAVSKEGRADINHPVIAYFGTGRLYGSSRNTMGAFLGRQIFKYGYYSWSDMHYSSYQYTRWLNSYRFLNDGNNESKAMYNAFVEAVKTANSYITKLDFDGEELRLKVKMSGEESETDFLPLSLHSDGIITHTAMTAELAFRCVMLNGHLGADAVKNSKGIVLIDELDLHLHPNWQRHIVGDLKQAFPEIQFVATTHSPFIVQSLSSAELINLDKITDVELNKLTLSEVAVHVMGAPSDFSQQNVTAENTSELYMSLLNQNDKKVVPGFNQKLDELEDSVSDPAVRAFLKMQRLQKNL